MPALIAWGIAGMAALAATPYLIGRSASAGIDQIDGKLVAGAVLGISTYGAYRVIRAIT